MKRFWLAAAFLALTAPIALSAPADAQDRVSGETIRDRIRDRMEKRRGDRIAPLGTATKAPGGGPGYESVLVKGQVRTFMRYTPNSVLVAAKKAPVVFALHGGKGTADKLQGYLGMNAVADREGFIVVYPQGLQNSWNDGRRAKVKAAKQVSEVDDVDFLNSLADSLVAQGVADPARTYIAGLSNGGFMSLRMACEGNSRFTAFATVIASLPVAAKETCKPGGAVKLVMINGSEDKLIRYDGGDGRLGASGNLAPPDAAKFVADLNGCTAPADTELPKLDAADATSVSKRAWSGCKPGGAVEFYTVKGGGHQAPTTGKVVSGTVIELLIGARSRQIDTAETVWEFFKRAQ